MHGPCLARALHPKHRMRARLLLRGETPAPEPGPWWTSRHPLWAKGFRPFFGLAALGGAVALPAWLAAWRGVLPVSSPLPPIAWHAHEMLFGYAAAVVAGFLLTAVSNWTRRPTAVGPALVGLAALWVVARIAALVGPRGPITTILATAFLVALAGAIARPLILARDRRNYGFVPLVLVLAAAQAAMLTRVTWIPWAQQVALDAVVVLIVVVGGRVLPMFTGNRIGGRIVRRPRWERASTAAVTALLGVDLIGWTQAAPAIAAVGGIALLVRMSGWGSLRTGRVPMLWIVHLGYAWVGLGLLLRAAAGLDLVPSSVAVHALTAGAIGAFTLGMMARVALGHTGRPIRAAALTTAGFTAMASAGALRVFGPWLAPGHGGWVEASGVLFAVALVGFLTVYAPLLTAPRRDGLAG